MAESEKQETLEGRLCGELAAVIARALSHGDKEEGAGRKGARFGIGSYRDRRSATRILTGLGLVEDAPPKRRPRETRYLNHMLSMDADDMPDFLATRIAAGDERMPELLESFWDFAAVSHSRRAFRTADKYRSVMGLLVQTGYAEQAADWFRWTDKIGLAMQACYLWDEKLRSKSPRNWPRTGDPVEWEAEYAWRTMPDAVRDDFFSKRPIDIAAATWVLECCWHDEAWDTENLRRVEGRPSGIESELARCMIEIAEEDDFFAAWRAGPTVVSEQGS